MMFSEFRNRDIFQLDTYEQGYALIALSTLGLVSEQVVCQFQYQTPYPTLGRKSDTETSCVCSLTMYVYIHSVAC